MKNKWTNRIRHFVVGKGFYIVLLLCILAIGASGYYLYSSLGLDGEDEPVSATAQIEIDALHSTAPTPSLEADVSPSESIQPAPSPSASASAEPISSGTGEASVSVNANSDDVESANYEEDVTTSIATPAEPVFTWPVHGTIITDFSLEVLAYSETMGDWRTHSGVDISAELGSEVMAVSSGTVEQIYQDDLMGTTVVIHHGSEFRSIYSNLALTPTVSVGDVVSTGDIIGSVGDTALAESSMQPHLHLEISQDSVAMDPMLYLPE